MGLLEDPKIRGIVIPRVLHKLAYIHVGKKYEDRIVKAIRDESVEGYKIYSVYDENDEHICSIENCPVIVYFEKGQVYED